MKTAAWASAVTAFRRGVRRRLSWRGPRTVTAVEWSGEWLKLAQVTGTASGKRLVRLEAGTVPSQEALPRMLQDLLPEAVRDADAVVISMPRNLVTVRNLRLPTTDPAELKEMVGLQAASLTPYAQEEIITSFQALRRRSDQPQAEDSTDVIVGIANREVSLKRLKALDDARLKAGAITLSSEGVLQWLSLRTPLPHSGEPVAVVDIDSAFTDFVVVADRQLIFTKMLPIGAGKLLGGQEAWLTQFVEEMKTALDLYERDGVGGPIVKAVITGAEIVVAGLEEQLKAAFGLAVERVSVLDRAPGAEAVRGVSETTRQAASFAAVVGLAWNPSGALMDLTPSEAILREGLARRGRDLAVLGVLLLSILMVLSGLLSERLYAKRRYLDALREEVLRTQDQADEVERLRREARIMTDLAKTRNASLEVLSLLHRVLPPQIMLTAVSFKAGDLLTLKGAAGEMSQVFQFVSVLEQQPAFSEVKVRQVASRGGEAEKRQAEFEVTCSLKAVEKAPPGTPDEEDRPVAF